MQLIFAFTIFYILLKNSAKCIPLSQFYPFGSGTAFGSDTFLPRNDDGLSPAISLTSVFPFFDENFNTIYVCSYKLVNIRTVAIAVAVSQIAYVVASYVRTKLHRSRVATIKGRELCMHGLPHTCN